MANHKWSGAFYAGMPYAVHVEVKKNLWVLSGAVEPIWKQVPDQYRGLFQKTRLVAPTLPGRSSLRGRMA
jgi:hypothetical protein